MKSVPSFFLALIAASLSGWLLTGSAVPLVLTLLVLVAASLFGKLARHLPLAFASSLERWLPPLLSLAAVALQVWLFRRGLAAADWRDDLPALFHLAIGLLWWISSDLLLRTGNAKSALSEVRSLVGVLAGLVLLTTCALTGGGGFGAWVLFPIAATPFALFLSRALLPKLSLSKSLAFVVVPTACVAAAFLLLSATASDHARIWLSREATDSPDAEIDGSDTATGGSGIMDGASRRIPQEADVRFKRQVILHLRAHSHELFRSWLKAPVYLRTSTLAQFEGDDVLSPIRIGQWSYDADDGIEDNTVTLLGSGGLASFPYTVYATRASIGHLPLLTRSTALFTDAIYEFADDWYQLAPPLHISRVRYTAAAPPLSPAKTSFPYDIRSLREQTSAESYLELPDSALTRRIIDLTAGFDRRDPLRGIKEYLASHTSYTLRFTTPEGSSPVEQFLFGTRQGHCEHYAAATVMMLRTLGIPSRIAYGYAGGVIDPGQGILAFRDSDFHAWAEVLVPDWNRWEIFETTPAGPDAAPRAPTTITIPAVDDAAYHDFSKIDPVTLTTLQGIEGGIADVFYFLSNHLFIAMGGALALLAAIGWYFSRGKQEDRILPSHPPGLRPSNSPPTPEFLLVFEDTAKSLGFRKRPGWTWRELHALVERSHSVPQEVKSAILYHYGVSYAGKPQNGSLEEDLLRSVQTWRKLVGDD